MIFFFSYFFSELSESQLLRLVGNFNDIIQNHCYRMKTIHFSRDLHTGKKKKILLLVGTLPYHEAKKTI